MVLEEISMPTAACHVKKPWHLSFTVTCERNRVHDSHDAMNDPFLDSTSGRDTDFSEHGLASPFGRDGAGQLVVIGRDLEEGALVRIPVGVAIWGDTRIEFYLHNGGKKKRKLAFFVCFHTSFYDTKSELSFLKNKVDKLCKNPSVPPDFELKLRLSQDPAHQHLEPEATFRKLFQEKGRLITYKKHDVVLHERNAPDVLRLIVAGSVQGLVYEMSDRSHNYHPLGCAIPFPERCRDAVGAARFPAIVMLGEGHVLGASQFLSGFGNMEFIARSHSVQVLELSKHSSHGHGAGESESQSTLASGQTPGQAPNNLASKSPRCGDMPSKASRHTSLNQNQRKSTEMIRRKRVDMGGYQLRNNVSPAALLRESSRATAGMVSPRDSTDNRAAEDSRDGLAEVPLRLIREKRASLDLVHANGVGPTNSARSEKALRSQSPGRASIELSRRHGRKLNIIPYITGGEEVEDDDGSASAFGHQVFKKVGKRMCVSHEFLMFVLASKRSEHTNTFSKVLYIVS
jgi:hypothetical protein